MYTNIDLEGIETVNEYICYFPSELDHPIPPEMCETIIQLLTLVMDQCMLEFSSTRWIQNIGTAMGAPCVYMYAILFFAWFENHDPQKIK